MQLAITIDLAAVLPCRLDEFGLASILSGPVAERFFKPSIEPAGMDAQAMTHRAHSKLGAIQSSEAVNSSGQKKIFLKYISLSTLNISVSSEHNHVIYANFCTVVIFVCDRVTSLCGRGSDRDRAMGGWTIRSPGSFGLSGKTGWRRVHVLSAVIGRRFRHMPC